MKKFIFCIPLFALVFGLPGCAQNKEQTIVNTYEQTPSDLIEEYTDNEEEVTWITYYEMSDGTWKTDEYAYQYRLILTGRMNHAACDTTYTILSNIESITFDQTWKASGLSSNLDDYFKPEDAVIVAVKSETLAEETITEETAEEDMEPVIVEADWSEYFEEINGAAVIYDPVKNCYQIYNQERAVTRRSPCSTFKIISSLAALEYGVIDPEDSVRAWSGETFWNAEWNRDIDFSDAFHASCVWYFRKIIDEIGKDRMQEELNRLFYGNCDISDWEGDLNTNNNNPALTGFWIESSLLISPKEQVEVLERIFGERTDYSEGTLNQLKEVMRLADSEHTEFSIYGKTGMGKANGVVVDAWYTGFADLDEGRVYFCVHLDETDAQEVSSARAKEIAVKIVSGQINH